MPCPLVHARCNHRHLPLKTAVGVRKKVMATLTGAESLAVRAVSRWIDTNPNAMGNWLRENQEIRNYDLVTAPFVEQIAAEDLEAAQVWADTIRDDSLRDALKNRTVGN